MDVMAVVQCDVRVHGVRRALFPGQHYNLPIDVATSGIAAGVLKAAEPARDKMVDAPPRDKGLRAVT